MDNEKNNRIEKLATTKAISNWGLGDKMKG
ncbi:hypothetical protein SAMN04489797_3145 [Winogradskyella sediminis]|uniref:Uncharacterized protein n=1 Tax=Winogradskyella sediminis TaxID=1382466 RepID=A0A1H1XBL4_9FLAO|nr:hypothetical protein SAMN04489797_3145 [Winogradskyella sediminis]